MQTDQPRKPGTRRAGEIFMVLALVVVLAATAVALLGPHDPGRATAAAAATASDASGPLSGRVGPSGLPLPRFVSLKAEITNVRRGPSSDHPVAFTYNRKGVPVEIIAEYEHWRRIRDSDGDEGWVYQSLLTGRRTALVAPWKKDDTVTFPLRQTASASAAPRALLKPGVVGEVEHCDGQWCEITVGSLSGWIAQNLLFGVYPAERIDG